MNCDVSLEEVAVEQWAFRLDSAMLSIVLPTAVMGAYVLYLSDRVVYVGRSDRCLRSRLRTHPLRSFTTHFSYQPCPSAHAAFLQEAAWFHVFKAEGALLNKVHPACPSGAPPHCPYCMPGDTAAWRHALRRSKWAADSVLRHEIGPVQKL